LKPGFRSPSCREGIAVPANTQRYSRFDVLDFYRYAGALFVALDHYLIVYLPVDRTLVMRISLQLQPLMGFFFTLSGFVIMHVYQGMSSRFDYVDYIQKRLARMYPLHLATLVFFVICPLLFGILRYWFSLDAILPNLLLVHAWGATDRLTFNYPSWSVSAEFFVYLLFPLFLLVVRRLGLWTALLVPCLCAILNPIFFDALGLRSWTSATFDFGCLRAVPSFIAGMVVYRLATIRFSDLTVPAWLAHGLAIATLPMMLAGAPGELALAVFVLVVFLLARAEPRDPGILSTPFFRALSNCSYGFYMLHVLVGAIVLGIPLRIFHLAQDVWKFILALVALVTTTVAALLSFRFFEDPARRFLGNLHWSKINARNSFAGKR
jgi:peptidoglycan/LPS O-acetylase OafA/YrhL